MKLADLLVASGTSPSVRLQREELRGVVWAALEQLAAMDRELLVLRYLEELTTREIAAVLDISERSVRSRHRRAMERMARLIEDPHSEE
jgi:RNA polymerase sigma-70 factor (ECF subfamily)